MMIERGDTFRAMNDTDGYPAVRVTNSGLGSEPDWITVSAVDVDQEQRVRDLAAALVKMADAMARERGR